MKRQVCPAILALSLVWFVAVQGFSAEQPSQPRDVGGSPPAVDSTTQARGFLDSADTLAIRSQVEGRTTILYVVPEGTVVSEGDLLVELDDSSLRDQMLKRQIIVEQARAVLSEAETRLQELREQDQNRLAGAELALKVAILQRDGYLAENGEYAFELLSVEAQIAISGQKLKVGQAVLESLGQEPNPRPAEVEQARLAVVEATVALEMSQAAKKLLTEYTRQYRSAQLELQVLQTTTALGETKNESINALKTADARLQAQKMTLEVESARLEHGQEQIAACMIHAPRDSVVVYANPGRGAPAIEEGSIVRERQRILLMPDMSRLTLLVRVPESRIERVREGQAAIIRVDAFPDRVFQGAVAQVSRMPLSANVFGSDVKEYSVLVSLENPTPELRLGLTAEVEIAAAAADK